jgi:hypothetical protein
MNGSLRKFVLLGGLALAVAALALGPGLIAISILATRPSESEVATLQRLTTDSHPDLPRAGRRAQPR